MAQSKNKKQMIINYVPGEECRVALVESTRLEEFHDERANAVTIVGNVYVGKVMNVEASIQAAFVDFGQGANGFLHVSDLHPQYFPGEDEETKERIGKKTPRRDRPPIQQCLKRGQEIIVQVLKEGISTKGPTLTTYLSIPGRYLVMLPQMDRVGVSRKVEDEDQRKEMRKILDGLELPGDFGFIVRTAGIGKSKADLKRDLAYLQRLWKDIERRRGTGKGPRLLYAESDLLMRALRDYWTSEIDEIVIDDESALRRAGRFMKIVSPRSSTKLLNYNRSTPIFHAYDLETQIHRMHERIVPLPSGGSLIFDETEALVAIDVNSGKMRHHGDAETTAYQTNIEAVDEICRQMRLRDVGGLVLCDLIDMMKRSNRRNIEQLFRDRLKSDRAATKPLPISQFGIVEMTRQRMRGSLRATHYTKCPTCSGRGVLRRPSSTASDALRELASILDHKKVHKIEMVVSPRLAGELLSNKRLSLTRIEFRAKKNVDVRVSEDIPVDQLRFYAYDESGADVAIDRLPKPSEPADLNEWAESRAAGKDWAVDTLTEHDEIETAVSSAEAEADAMDGFLAEDEDERSAGDTPKDGKSSRRRRRRRRKPREDEKTSDAPEPAKDTTDEQADIARQHEPKETEDDGRPRKRRRRRRGGRSRDRDSESAPSEGAPAKSGADEPAKAKPDKGSGSGSEPAGPAAARELRGDSWDVSPGELASSNGKVSAPSDPPARDTSSAEESDKKPRSRKKSGKRRSSKKPQPTPPAQKEDGQATPKPSGESKRTPRKKSETKKKASTRAADSQDSNPVSENKPAAKKRPKRSSRKKSPSSQTKGDTKKPAAAPAEKGKSTSRTLYASQRKKPAPGARTARED